MAEQLIQVREDIANFVNWANEKGQDAITQMVHDCLEEYKNDKRFKWDPVLDANDGVDQWKRGGDCNRCRKIQYCMNKCRANRLLKKLTTPYLYQKYLEDHPEAEAEKIKQQITPEDIERAIGKGEVTYEEVGSEQ